MHLEAKLNKTLKKLQDIELALNESSIVAITNRRGIIQFANNKFCEISKYSREELIGQDHILVIIQNLFLKNYGVQSSKEKYGKVK